MTSEFQTVRTRILTSPTRRSLEPPQRPQDPLEPLDPPITPNPLTPPHPSTPFLTLLTTHLTHLSTTRISQGFLHLHPSPIHTAPYLPTPQPHYTHLTDLLRRIDINLSTIPQSKLQTFFSHLLTRQIHRSTLLSQTSTDLATTCLITNTIFTSPGGIGIRELNLPDTERYTSEITHITNYSPGTRCASTTANQPLEFKKVLKARDSVYSYTKALTHFLTALLSKNGELTQDLIKQTHKILVTDNPPVDSKPWEHYGGWYRDYRVLTTDDINLNPIPQTSLPSPNLNNTLSGSGSNNTNNPSTPRRSSSVYTFNQPEFRRTSSIYSLPPENFTPRRYSSYSSSISTPSSLTTSPTSPRRGSSLYYPITPITELCEEEEQEQKGTDQPHPHTLKDHQIFPSFSSTSPTSPYQLDPQKQRRESIDPRAVSIYMSKLINTYHAQLAMDRSTTKDDPSQSSNIQDILKSQEPSSPSSPSEEEEPTVSDPFALTAWLTTEFLHIHPFITGNEEMSRIILSGVLIKELGIVVTLGEPGDDDGGRAEYLGILERCEEKHREGGGGQAGGGESYAEFAALVVKKALEGVEEIATMVGRS
ncbi:hypothetical protein TWF718_002436 [Orbilia javanica]|uniref:Fido domain-containing protein n=1 Tax=Orbilia javanica TaxID=47235 RepID=A0AAN8MMG0_9PEZI